MIKELYNKVKNYDQFYIIGTNTDVGKSYVGNLLLREYLENDSHILALKPVETGLENKAIGPDTQLYIDTYKTYGLEIEQAVINIFNMNLPASPHLSKELEGKEISVKDIIAWLETKAFAFIELAGGLMVPLNERETQFDLMKKYKKPVVLVTESGLGMLNHVLLTMEALSDFDVIIVMNRYNPDDIIQKTNYNYLNKRFEVILN